MIIPGAYYTIGGAHTVCQDYAVASSSVVAVSDGCSGAISSDVGARIIAHTALRVLSIPGFKETGPIGIARIIGIQAQNAAASMGLLDESLSASLLVSYIYEDDILIKAYGDGVIFIKFKDGTKMFYNIWYDKEQPAYPYYYMHPQFIDNSMASESRKHIHRISWVDESRWCTMDEKIKKIHVPFELEYPGENIEYLMMFSDGINSFLNKDKEAINIKDIIDSFTALPLLSKGAAERKCLATFMQHEKDGITHYDDFSMGSMIWKSD